MTQSPALNADQEGQREDERSRDVSNFKIADSYMRELTIKPGDRFHRLVAMLFDTHYDDVTDERLGELERLVGSWRWMNAAGERIDDGREGEAE